MKPATDLPWKLFSLEDRVDSADGEPICEYAAPQDARYIVHACNLYPRLEQALAECIDLLITIQRTEEGEGFIPWTQTARAAEVLADCEPDAYPSGTVDDLERYPNT